MDFSSVLSQAPRFQRERGTDAGDEDRVRGVQGTLLGANGRDQA